MRILLVAVLLSVARGEDVHFHHLQLNVTDPAAAAAFYTSRFACEGVTEAGIRVHAGWLQLRKVKRAPDATIESAIWHFGWGAEDMRRAYQEQLSKGTEFETPLTDISDLAGSPGFYYAYVKGPDGALIELNTAKHHRFGHVHLLSADPVAAGFWWAKHFGVRWPAADRSPSREPRFYKGSQVAPSVSFSIDGVNVIIFPVEYLRRPVRLRSTRGRVVDHLGLRVDDLDATLRQLRAAGVRVLHGVKRERHGRVALIEGPDRLAIQLVERGAP